ncbi:brain-specific serine protease 4-like [Belonocnema kinseyi]|uniref:brain-specific serine protease 4-like n=1 Tax=Belonocnema kinseyi TaxID=2817044 RepID=UPI00143CE55F|nr:brain-specific serine protease 4-like [Belonocnema kinseyi]
MRGVSPPTSSKVSRSLGRELEMLLCEDQCQTQYELAEVLGVDRSTISGHIMHREWPKSKKIGYQESSVMHIRKKRIIDKTPSGRLPEKLERAPCIVNILKNGVSHCAGCILHSMIVITAAYCVRDTYPFAKFTILSGSEMRNNGTFHRIQRKLLHPHSDLALVLVDPPIDIKNGPNRRVDIYRGAVRPYAYGRFSGWGCTSLPVGRDPIFPEQLMITRLPIISVEECIESLKTYNGYSPVTHKNICTLDISNRRGTCHGDGGGPLLYPINSPGPLKLLGIMSYLRGVIIGKHADVFVNLNHPELHLWVIRKMHELQAGEA